MNQHTPVEKVMANTQLIYKRKMTEYMEQAIKKVQKQLNHIRVAQCKPYP